MRFSIALVLAAGMGTAVAHAGDWRAQTVDTPARMLAIESHQGQALVNAGGLWYRMALDGPAATLHFVDTPARPAPPDGALGDGRIAQGRGDIRRAWFAEPTSRYDHGILGDKTEAGTLVIETREGRIHTLRLRDDAVFEDLEPRLADLDGDGHEEIVVVKSYLARGAALAVIALRKGRYEIVAETPPLGSAHRWLNPAGIGDFNGDGKTDIALVRQPHVVGELQLWTYSEGRLRQTGSLADTSNHAIGSRVLGLSASADFDGDGTPDLALPSLDRRHLRIVSFVPVAHDIASIALPAPAATNIAPMARGNAAPALAVGLADGSLVVIRND